MTYRKNPRARRFIKNLNESVSGQARIGDISLSSRIKASEDKHQPDDKMTVLKKRESS